MLLPLIEKYGLSLAGNFSQWDNQWVALLCVNINSRPECHFTPYGKNEFINFRADSLVEYSFATFQGGLITPSGSIRFKFYDDTPQEKIDSLFIAYGLRFLYTSPDFEGITYKTLITSKANKNVLDLGEELNSISFSFIQWIDVELITSTYSPQCD